MMHILVLFLQLLTISLPSIAGEAAQLVYDTEGHELSSHSRYYILPADHGAGGGFTMHDGTGMDCTFLVGQVQEDEDEGADGLAVRIKPLSDGAIGISSNVTITFDVFTTCVESMHWYITGPPISSTEQRQYVGTGKLESGGPIPPSVFRIERYGGATKGYELVWCTDDRPCKDLGLYASAEGKNLLITSDSPLAVVFKKKSRAV